jgi:hypothetical protein
MSRNINVNPGHYKVAGRERQGEDILQQAQKQAYTTQQADVMGDGVPPWEATRHSFASAQPAEKTPAKKARKPTAKRRTAQAKRPAVEAKRAAARKTSKKAARAKKPVRAPRGTARRPAASRSGLRERRVKRSTRRR